jgi:phosphohistidine phosphatase SixA
MRTPLLVCALVLHVATGAVALAQPAQAERDVAPAELIKRLQAGGYTLHFRHAITDSHSDDGAAADDDCARQRNLSEAGRAQARAIGESIRALNVPVGATLAGPRCRTMETARLMIGRAQSDWEVRGGGLDRADYPGLRRLLSTQVPPGTNQILIGHGHQFLTVAKTASELGEGDAAVVLGLGREGFRVIGTLRSGDWANALRAVNAGRAASPSETATRVRP